MRAYLILYAQTTCRHQTVQTITNNNFVANCLYVNTLHPKTRWSDNFFVFCKYNIFPHQSSEFTWILVF